MIWSLQMLASTQRVSSSCLDFGFATLISLPEDSQDEDSHVLYNKCGTPRYMAPEIHWELGYGLPADVYS